MIWLGTRTGGRLLDDDARAVSAADRGYTLGEGVFETMRVWHGRPFALTRHLARFQGSARILGLPAPDLSVVRSAIRAVLDANAHVIAEGGRLRVTYTAGVPSGEPTLVVTCVALSPWSDTSSAVTVPWVRNERSAIAGAKSTSFAENLVALQRAHAADADEALLANTQGDLCEGTGSNVFIVMAGEVLTPNLSSGCLPGVTRGLVLEWCHAQEARLPYDVLHSADEIFLTSSTRGVHPVARLDDRTWAGVGPVTARVREQFVALAADSIDP